MSLHVYSTACFFLAHIFTSSASQRALVQNPPCCFNHDHDHPVQDSKLKWMY
jgi:hypothetical protein